MSDDVTPAVLAGAGEGVRAYLRMGAGEDGAVAEACAAACGLAARWLGQDLADVWEDVPGAVRHGIVLWAAHLLEHRDGAPIAALAALRPYRAMRLQQEPTA